MVLWACHGHKQKLVNWNPNIHLCQGMSCRKYIQTLSDYCTKYTWNSCAELVSQQGPNAIYRVTMDTHGKSWSKTNSAEAEVWSNRTPNLPAVIGAYEHGNTGIRNSLVLWLAQHGAELWSNKVRKYDGQGSNSERAESSTQLLDYHILTQHELAQPVQWTRVPISSRLSGETRVAMPLLAWEQCLYDLQQVMICKCIQRIAL